MEHEYHCNEGDCREIKIGRCIRCGGVFCDDHHGRHDCEALDTIDFMTADTGEG